MLIANNNFIIRQMDILMLFVIVFIVIMVIHGRYNEILRQPIENKEHNISV